MRFQSILLILVFLKMFMFAPAGYGAVIELQSGKILKEAEILESSEKLVTIRCQDSILRYKWHLIKSIDGMAPFTAEFPVPAHTTKTEPSVLPSAAVAIRGETPWIQEKDREKKEANTPVTPQEEKSDFDRGMNHAVRGEFSQAEEFFLTAQKETDTARNAEEALHILTDFYQGDIDAERAINLFKGAQHMIKEEYRQAIAVYQEILENTPEAIEVYYNIGDAYNTLGEYKEAIGYFEKIIETNPDDIDVWFHLAFAYYSTDRYQEAIPYFEKITEAYPESAEAFTLLGVSYESVGQYAPAKENISEARRLFSLRNDSKKALELDTLLKEYRLKEIKETIEDVLGKGPSS